MLYLNKVKNLKNYVYKDQWPGELFFEQEPNTKYQSTHMPRIRIKNIEQYNFKIYFCNELKLFRKKIIFKNVKAFRSNECKTTKESRYI